jgi:hypothetical protein
MKRLALQVSLKEQILGTIELSTQPSLIPWNWEKEIQAAIATVCFMRDDDLMQTHAYEDFTVKGVAIQ